MFQTANTYSNEEGRREDKKGSGIYLFPLLCLSFQTHEK